LKSEFSVFYLDDGTLGGYPDEVKKDLLKILEMSQRINLALNQSKSKLIARCDADQGVLLLDYPSFVCVDPVTATMLGSPIGDLECVSSVLQSKVDSLQLY
jgi:hypothetical protein